MIFSLTEAVVLKNKKILLTQFQQFRWWISYRRVILTQPCLAFSWKPHSVHWKSRIRVMRHQIRKQLKTSVSFQSGSTENQTALDNCWNAAVFSQTYIARKHFMWPFQTIFLLQSSRHSIYKSWIFIEGCNVPTLSCRTKCH